MSATERGRSDTAFKSEVVPTKFVPMSRPLPASDVCKQAHRKGLRTFTLSEIQPYIDDEKRFAVDGLYLTAVETADGRQIYVIEFFADATLMSNAKVRPIGSGEDPGCNPRYPWLFVQG